ncbi:hypothetical protein IFM89_011977, partial [Coptis chinensis]
MEDVEGEDCEVLHSTLSSKNNINNVELKPTLGMKFSSFEDAIDFYNRHAMQKGFGTKIKNSYNKKNTYQRQFMQFSCSKEGFKVEKEGVLYKRPNSMHKGILCRHALYVLNEFVDEIPSHYILPKWRKDSNRKYVESCESLNFEASNPVQRYGILYPCTIQILEEGASSESKFKTILGVLQDLKRKLVDESNNLESVEDELVGTHPSESPKSVQPGYVNLKFLNPLQAKRVGRPKVTVVPKSSNHKATNKNISSHDTCGNEHNITSNQFQENMSMDGTFASYLPGFFTSQLLEPRQLYN